MRIEHNEQMHGVELYFEGVPSAEVRNTLKSNGFRWHGLKKCWYAKENAQTLVIVATLDGQPTTAQTGDKTPQISDKKQAVNKYGVKVGDLFVCSWGYDQTNLTFCQVIEIIGTASIRVKEVRPETVKEGYYCSMSRDIYFKTPENGELLPTIRNSIFIKDKENGDIKRVKQFSYDNEIGFSIDSYSFYKYNGEKLYESWYA